MGQTKKIFYKAIVFLLCLIILSACQNTVSKAKIDGKEDIERLIKEKSYIEIHEFIKDNVQNEEKKSLVEFGISSLAQTNHTENISFIKNMLHNLLENKRWNSIKELIVSLENEGNRVTIDRIKEEINGFQEKGQLIEELEKQKVSLIEKKDELIKEYPYETKWQGL